VGIDAGEGSDGASHLRRDDSIVGVELMLDKRREMLQRVHGFLCEERTRSIERRWFRKELKFRGRRNRINFSGPHSKVSVPRSRVLARIPYS
jgi:hypothetical protein